MRNGFVFYTRPKRLIKKREAVYLYITKFWKLQIQIDVGC
jgi:hypothetical protein